MTERIVALDPGGTTGWAMWTDPESREPSAADFTCGQISGDDHHQQLWNLLGGFQTHLFTVVTERFEFRQNSRPGLELISREYIGVAKLFYQERMENLGQRLALQNASQAKGFVEDKHLNSLGLGGNGVSHAGKFKHAADAYRHLIYYIVNGHHYRDRQIRRWLLETAFK